MRRRSVLYAVVHDDERVTFGHSPRPEVDRRFWLAAGARHLIPLGPSLPPMWAELACRALAESREVQAVVSPAGGSAADGAVNVWSSSGAGLRFRFWRGPGVGFSQSRNEGPGSGAWTGLGAFRSRLTESLLRWPLGRRGPAHDRPLWKATVWRAAAQARCVLQAAGYAWAADDGTPGRRRGSIAPYGCAGAWVEDGRLAQPGAELESHPPSATALAGVAALLRGRLLTGAEVVRQVELAGLALERPLEECLTWLVLLGQVQRLPGVYPAPLGGFRCTRCGECDQVRPWDCAACGERACWRCDACRALGVVSACVFLYAAGVDEAAAAPPAAGCGPDPRSAAGNLACANVLVNLSAPTSTGPTWPPRPARTALAAARGFELAGPARLERRPVTVRLPALTEAQRRAAWALEGFVRQRERREALVWAVCGAGKTEVTFTAAGRVLARGGRVLFAVPRRDVVQELGPRFAAAFPSAEIRVLHGGPDRVDRPGLDPGSLTVATTHQVLRFYQAFDLAVLDEVDAYPYRGSPMLVRAVARALRTDGHLIRMSATPDEAMIAEARSGKSLLVPIPARHHGHPLPVPELLVDRSLVPGEDGQARPYRPSEMVLSLVRRSLSGTPPARLLVFVPTIALAERVGRGMAAALAPTEWRGRVGWSHSRDPEREAKRRAFLDGRLLLLVATTILERGITVPDVDVIVLFSDVEHIFQTAALVQMAGRVGRTTARPTGRVAFVGRRVSRAMRMAVEQIEGMNRLAREMGLLRV